MWIVWLIVRSLLVTQRTRKPKENNHYDGGTTASKRFEFATATAIWLRKLWPNFVTANVLLISSIAWMRLAIDANSEPLSPLYKHLSSMSFAS